MRRYAYGGVIFGEIPDYGDGETVVSDQGTERAWSGWGCFSGFSMESGAPGKNPSTRFENQSVRRSRGKASSASLQTTSQGTVRRLTGGAFQDELFQ